MGGIKLRGKTMETFFDYNVSSINNQEFFSFPLFTTRRNALIISVLIREQKKRGDFPVNGREAKSNR
jgi:hypothetical protein